jgi:hypothetical protein
MCQNYFWNNRTTSCNWPKTSGSLRSVWARESLCFKRTQTWSVHSEKWQQNAQEEAWQPPAGPVSCHSLEPPATGLRNLSREHIFMFLVYCCLLCHLTLTVFMSFPQDQCNWCRERSGSWTGEGTRVLRLFTLDQEGKAPLLAYVISLWSI